MVKPLTYDNNHEPTHAKAHRDALIEFDDLLREAQRNKMHGMVSVEVHLHDGRPGNIKVKFEKNRKISS